MRNKYAPVLLFSEIRSVLTSEIYCTAQLLAHVYKTRRFLSVLLRSEAPDMKRRMQECVISRAS